MYIKIREILLFQDSKYASEAHMQKWFQSSHLKNWAVIDVNFLKMCSEFLAEGCSANPFHSIDLDHTFMFIDSQHFILLSYFADLWTIFTIDHQYLFCLIILLLVSQQFLLNLLPRKHLETETFSLFHCSRIYASVW